MIEFKKYWDAALTEENAFLEVPSEDVEILLNANTCPESRLSDDMKLVYLAKRDQELFLDALNRHAISYIIQPEITPTPCFVQNYSTITWQ
ncbi:MAG: hypothetical protein CML22_07005 [Rheinheimera sp.]|nr:hypothetical protein [Rheinheimera sp.]MBM34032.1 hypothetical protein [Rheinheimera sp.]|tara:strand:- start:790 stop:1062 length:273 start_codon:yes stop_codon:yes gene_type:complete